MFIGRAADKRGSDIIIIPGLILLFACFAVLPSLNTMTALVILALPMGVAQGALTPAFNSMLFQRCSPARRGTASGAFYIAIDGGFAIGGPLLGLLADMFDFRYIFWASAVFAVFSLTLYLLIASDKRYNARRLKRLAD